MFTTDDGVDLMRALTACEQAQAQGVTTESAVDSAALACNVDAFRLLGLVLEKEYACAEAKAWLVETRTDDE